MTSPVSETAPDGVRVRDRHGDEEVAAAVGKVASRLPASLRDDLDEIVLVPRVIVPGELSRLEIGERVRVVVVAGALASDVPADARALTASVLEHVLLQLARYALLRQGDGLLAPEDARVRDVAEELLARVRDG